MNSKCNIPFSRVYLSSLKSLINRKDLRSIRKWCKKNNLCVYKDSSGEFVYQTEFELAYDMPLISSLCARYKDEWKKYYKLYKDGNTFEAINFIGDNVRPKPYQPKGKITKKIFDASPK